MARPNMIRLFEEISVLNEIIRDNCKIYKLRQCIDPFSASIKRHRILSQVIGQLHALNQFIDLTSLACYLADHDLLDEIGGCRYLQYIADFHRSGAARAGSPGARRIKSSAFGGVSR
jgi:replicative DNA helicase